MSSMVAFPIDLGLPRHGSGVLSQVRSPEIATAGPRPPRYGSGESSPKHRPPRPTVSSQKELRFLPSLQGRSFIRVITSAATTSPAWHVVVCSARPSSSASQQGRTNCLLTFLLVKAREQEDRWVLCVSLRLDKSEPKWCKIDGI